MDSNTRSGVIRLADGEAAIPGPTGARAAQMLKRGTLDLTLSIPEPPNVQSPHAQDELYVVIRGHGVLVRAGARTPFGPGDVLFVAAGEEHHYADFSGDLALWRIFYGAEGGEIPPA